MVFEGISGMNKNIQIIGKDMLCKEGFLTLGDVADANSRKQDARNFHLQDTILNWVVFFILTSSVLFLFYF